MFRTRYLPVLGLLFLTIVCSSLARGEEEPRFDFNIESQPLADALAAFGRQAHFDVLYSIAPGASAIRSPAVIGRFTVKEALRQLLAGTGGGYVKAAADMIVFQVPEPASSREPVTTAIRYVPGVPPPPPPIPEVMVHGSRSTNADIARSKDDAEPYVVFTHEDIELSQASDLAAFLASALPSLNSSGGGAGQADVLGTSRTMDLRGLGQKQTLVLIDGRRMAGVSYGGDALQPDVSVIPLEAIERIEVLPTSASARYGGGATAGVINIVLRRGDLGTHTSVQAQRLAQTDGGFQHFFMGHNAAFADGRGHLSLWAHYAAQSPVSTQQWDFVSPGRERIARNNPNAFAPLPPLSDLVNLRTLDGSPLFKDAPGDHLYIPRDFDSRFDSFDQLKQTLGQFRLSLSPSAQLQGGAFNSLRAESDVRSVSAMANYAFNPRLSGDIDLRFAQTQREAWASGADFTNVRGALLPADAPTNPFGKDLLVSIPVDFADGLLASRNRLGRAATALQVQWPRDWVTRLEYTWSFSDVTLSRPTLNLSPQALSDGEIDLFSSPIWQDSLQATRGTLKTSDVRTTVAETALRVGGRAFALPSGDAQLTVLLNQRQERLAQGSASQWLIPQDGTSQRMNVLPEQRETVSSAYAELRVPVLASSKPDVAHLLETQLSVRADRYRADTARYALEEASLLRSVSEFSAASWMASAKWQPARRFFLRAHCGTGFLPPSVSDLTLPTVQVIPSPGMLDPARGGETVGTVTVLAGGNPALEPERSRSCGAGAVFGVSQGEGLRVSADFTRLAKSQVIYSPNEWLLLDPTTFLTRLPNRVTRAPRAAGDPYAVGRITQIDASSLNLSSNEVRSWDLAFGYTARPTRLGTFKFSALATLQPKFLSQLTPDSPEINDAGVGVLAPSRYRVSADASLEKGPWLLGWTARYIPHYIVSRDSTILLNQGARYVDAQQYHDVYASYTLGMNNQWNAVTRVQLGAHNVFQHRPPFDAAALNYYSRYGESEMPSYYVLLRADF